MKTPVNPMNKLTVVTLVIIYILGKARADTNEMLVKYLRNFLWRRNTKIVNHDFPNIICTLFALENIINGFQAFLGLSITFSICEA